MASEKPPLVLLHPFLLSGNVWHDVIPYLAGHHEVYTPTLLGHRGGPPVQRHPATITDVIDVAERFLDDQRLERPHLVGNSTGGYVAIELARRGHRVRVIPGGFLVDRGRFGHAGGQQSPQDRRDRSRCSSRRPCGLQVGDRASALLPNY
jgi:pimeloyl-ACP methyl ester carboxylesterase